MESASRVVIGGGLFGCFAALVLAQKGHEVALLEQDPELMMRASFVNQARLHTGLHYPRSLLTARESLSNYHRFRLRFPSSIKDFEQIYAISEHNSQTGTKEFERFIARLRVDALKVDVDQYFHPNTVAGAYKVEEPTFDAAAIRAQLIGELEAAGVAIHLNERVVAGSHEEQGITCLTESGLQLRTDGVVIATYASTNTVRSLFGLAPLPLKYELTEVILGDAEGSLHDRGFTVMDGPFWSIMPFGHTGQSSLTSVSFTPLRIAARVPQFDCQNTRADCDSNALKSCLPCTSRPSTSLPHQLQQMQHFLKDSASFSPRTKLLTVKTVLASTEVDDARPTVIVKANHCQVWTVFSGKVSSVFELEEALS